MSTRLLLWTVLCTTLLATSVRAVDPPNDESATRAKRIEQIRTLVNALAERPEPAPLNFEPAKDSPDPALRLFAHFASVSADVRRDSMLGYPEGLKLNLSIGGPEGPKRFERAMSQAQPTLDAICTELASDQLDLRLPGGDRVLAKRGDPREMTLWLLTINMLHADAARHYQAGDIDRAVVRVCGLIDAAHHRASQPGTSILDATVAGRHLDRAFEFVQAMLDASKDGKLAAQHAASIAKRLNRLDVADPARLRALSENACDLTLARAERFCTPTEIKLPLMIDIAEQRFMQEMSDGGGPSAASPSLIWEAIATANVGLGRGERPLPDADQVRETARETCKDLTPAQVVDAIAQTKLWRTKLREARGTERWDSVVAEANKAAEADTTSVMWYATLPLRYSGRSVSERAQHLKSLREKLAPSLPALK